MDSSLKNSVSVFSIDSVFQKMHSLSNFMFHLKEGHGGGGGFELFEGKKICLIFLGVFSELKIYFHSCFRKG